MKKLSLLILIFIGFISSIYAQSLSIRELWSQIDQAGSIQEKRLNKEAQEEQLHIRRAERFPAIYGDVNFQRNLIIPTTPVPAIAFDPNAQEGAILPLKFSTKWNSKAGLQLEWELFNPSKKSQRQEDQIAIEKAKIEESTAKQDWKINATLAYASIVLATEQYKSAMEDSVLYSEINTVIKDRYEAGRSPSDEYLLSQQEYQRKRIRLHEAWSILEEANLELSRYYPIDNIQLLSDGIEEILNELGNYEVVSYNEKMVELDQQLSGIQLNGIKKQVLPTVSLNGYYGAQYFSNSFKIIDKSSWYGYSYANLGLKIPISAYFSNTRSIRKARLNQKIFDQQLANILLNDEISNKQKRSKISSAKQKIAGLNQIQNLALQSKNEKLSSYQEGRILLNDFNKSNSDYLKASQDVWQAKYDLLKIILEQ